MTGTTERSDDDVILSAVALFKDPLRPVTRERQQQLLVVSALVLLVSLSIATVAQPKMTIITGIEVSLAKKEYLAGLTVALILYLLVIFAFDAFQDLYASRLESQHAWRMLSGKPKEFMSAIRSSVSSLRAIQAGLQQASSALLATGSGNELDSRISAAEKEHEDISNAIGKDLDDPEKWQAWARCREDIDRLNDERDEERHHAALRVQSLLEQLASESSRAPSTERIETVSALLRAYPRIRLWRVRIEVWFPLVFGASAIGMVIFRAT